MSDPLDIFDSAPRAVADAYKKHLKPGPKARSDRLAEALAPPAPEPQAVVQELLDRKCLTCGSVHTMPTNRVFVLYKTKEKFYGRLRVSKEVLHWKLQDELPDEWLYLPKQFLRTESTCRFCHICWTQFNDGAEFSELFLTTHESDLLALFDKPRNEEKE